jgi:hypothetical protein
MRQPRQHLGKYYYAYDNTDKSTDSRQFAFCRPDNHPEGATGSQSHAQAHDQPPERTLQTCRVSNQPSGGVLVTPEHPDQSEYSQGSRISLEEIRILEQDQVAESSHDAVSGSLSDITDYQA